MDRMQGTASFDPQVDSPVAPLPRSDILPLVPVWHAGLTQHGVLVRDLLVRIRLDVAACLD